MYLDKKLQLNKKLKHSVFIAALSLLFTFGLTYRFDYERYSIFLVMPLCFYMLVKRKLTPFDLPFILLLAVYGLRAVYLYRLNPTLKYMYSEVAYYYIVPLVYLFGKLLVGDRREELNNRIFKLLLAMMSGMYLQALLDYGSKIARPCYGYGHAWYAFWGVDYIVVRNTFDYGFILVSASVFYAILNRKDNKKFFWSICIAETIALIFNFINEGRTNICMVVLIFIINFSFYSFHHWNEYSKKLKSVIVVTGAIFAIVVMVASIAISLGMVDAGKIEDDKFWARGGGVLGNIRITMAWSGLKNIFLYQKGGWENTSGDSTTTHNTWLEYGRNFDVIIFMILAVFVVVVIYNGFRLLVKYGKEYKIIYLLVGCQLGLFTYLTMEPNGYFDMRFSFFFFIICGMVAGFSDIIQVGELQLMNYSESMTTSWNKWELDYRYFGDLPILFIGLALINMQYIDFYNNRISILDKLLLPIAAYALGKLVKNQKLLLLITAGITTVLFVYTYLISYKSDYYMAGFCFDPFSGNVVEKALMLAFLIIPVSLLIGFVSQKVKVNKIIYAGALLIIIGALFRHQIRDGRLHLIKEALIQFIKQPWGSFEITSSPLNTSHDMWLDYARDYGVPVAAYLIIAVIVLCVGFVMVVIDRNIVSNYEYTIIAAFIMFNMFFLIESVAFNYTYLMTIGFIIFGMMQRLYTEHLVSHN